ncbi:MAG: hypothetical protein ABI112_17910 [Terracoccus sp.]
MADENLSSRLRGVNDLGVAAMLLLLAGVAFEIVAIIRVFQEGSPFVILFIGLALIVLGMVLGRRSIAQGPRKSP